MAEVQDIPAPDAQPESSIPLPPDPTPSNGPASPPSAKPVPSPATLKSWLPLYLHKTDLVIDHLGRMLSTPSGIDKVLMAIGYSSLAASSLLSSVSRARLYAAALQLIRAAADLPAGTTVLVDAAKLPAPRILRAARSLEALSSLISDFRIFARLWGMIGIWQWGRGVLESPPRDVTVRAVTYAQVLVNVVYQILENGAYLSSKSVLGWSAEAQNKAWLWSSRCWAAHVGLEFVRLGRELAQRRARGKGEVKDVAAQKAEVEGWRREVVVNAAYAPMTVHWSLEKGCISPLTVGVLGSVVGVINVTRLWETTA